MNCLFNELAFKIIDFGGGLSRILYMSMNFGTFIIYFVIVFFSRSTEDRPDRPDCLLTKFKFYSTIIREN